MPLTRRQTCRYHQVPVEGIYIAMSQLLGPKDVVIAMTPAAEQNRPLSGGTMSRSPRQAESSWVWGC